MKNLKSLTRFLWVAQIILIVLLAGMMFKAMKLLYVCLGQEIFF